MPLDLEVNSLIVNDSGTVRLTRNGADETLLRQSESIQL